LVIVAGNVPEKPLHRRYVPRWNGRTGIYG